MKNRRLVHLPEVATGRGFEGSRQIRPYKFEGGRLVLGDVETQIPEVVRWKIVWEKVRSSRLPPSRKAESRVLFDWAVIHSERRKTWEKVRNAAIAT